MKKKKLFLLSSSRLKGGDILEHCKGALKRFLRNIPSDTSIALITYALKGDAQTRYVSAIRKAFRSIGFTNLILFDEYPSPSILFQSKPIKAVFVGGGNTFRLLGRLSDEHLLIHAIQRRALDGDLRYIGASAGANVACPTIMTTNDMPIVELESFTALNLVPFQINPHFVSGKLLPEHMGETREERIAQFFEENTSHVVGLPEPNWIVVNGEDNVRLEGKENAMIFTKNGKSRIWKTKTKLLLE